MKKSTSLFYISDKNNTGKKIKIFSFYRQLLILTSQYVYTSLTKTVA